jgi:hypothetical protein
MKMIDCECGGSIHPARFALGYRICLACGEAEAKKRKFTVAIPYGKGAYQLIHNPADLFNTNQKQTRGA